jgi:radical SAM enzyme (TIGR04100 family)
MNKSMTILYPLHDNLYVNLTNRCPCSCTFCLRQTMDHVGASDPLWLEHEPDFDEVVKAFEQFDMSRYKELVFCGFGEPTERIDLLLQVADYAKEKFHIATRLNTNGLGNLVNDRDITPSLQGRIDTISISLNTPDREEYQRLVRSKFGIESFDAMLSFAKESTKYVPNVILSTVDTTISSEEEEKCRAICDEIGVTYRIRPFEE